MFDQANVPSCLWFCDHFCGPLVFFCQTINTKKLIDVSAAIYAKTPRRNQYHKYISSVLFYREGKQRQVSAVYTYYVWVLAQFV